MFLGLLKLLILSSLLDHTARARAGRSEGPGSCPREPPPQMVVPPSGLEPARLVSSSCSLKKVLQCSCSFQGAPAPHVQWWLEGDFMGVDGADGVPQVTSTVLAPWSNTTISLMPETGTDLLCKGENDYGSQAMSTLLLSIKSPLVAQSFINGLFQGLIYGVIATTLLCLCLIPLIVTHIRKTLSKKIAAITAEKIPSEPSMALKAEEPGKASTTLPSESQSVRKEEPSLPAEARKAPQRNLGDSLLLRMHGEDQQEKTQLPVSFKELQEKDPLP